MPFASSGPRRPSFGGWRALFAFGAALILGAVPACARAAEYIEGFDSAIRVQADGDLIVTETILVRAEGSAIKRGIYRDFPTRYRAWYGRAVVPFEVLSVRRGGAPEPWHTEQRSNGVRLYLGSVNRMLPHGMHEYEIRYRTAWQLGHFADHDELYWNVTGNDWQFPIRSASARVILPAAVGLTDLRLDAYTGPQGARGQDWVSRVDEEGNPWFRTSAPLAAHEGLTIVVGWPKGFVAEPDRAQRIERWSADNPEWRAGVIGLAALLAYYLVVWYRVGRDPPGGTVIPRFEPPPEVSPADARFLTRMAFDARAFAAALIGLAVKGHLRIVEDEDRDFTLERRAAGAGQALANDEKALLDALGLAPGGALAMRSENASRLQAARRALQGELRKEHVKRNFINNAGYLIPGLIASVAILAYAASRVGTELGFATVFMLAWLTGWTFGVYMLLSRVWDAWRSVRRGKYLMILPALFITAFAIPFVGGEILGLYLLTNEGSPLVAVLLALLAGINYAFYRWLKAPTRAGRGLYDQIAGFRMYLDVAEKDRLNLAGPPERTIELFERYLPYALALDVENRWSEQFSDVIARARDEGRGAAVRPWYRGPSWDGMSSTAFAGAMADGFSNAVASASSPPGSSSGGGGGGSSGGGGGGGGGGGW